MSMGGTTDVVFEHLHYRTGKAACDETYKRRGRFEDDPTFIAMAERVSETLSKAFATFTHDLRMLCVRLLAELEYQDFKEKTYDK